LILPYIEQDELYACWEARRLRYPGQSSAHTGGIKAGLDDGCARLAAPPDGTSNTIFFSEDVGLRHTLLQRDMKPSNTGRNLDESSGRGARRIKTTMAGIGDRAGGRDPEARMPYP
jgi:hypothetical protein